MTRLRFLRIGETFLNIDQITSVHFSYPYVNDAAEYKLPVCTIGLNEANNAECSSSIYPFYGQAALNLKSFFEGEMVNAGYLMTVNMLTVVIIEKSLTYSEACKELIGGRNDS